MCLDRSGSNPRPRASLQLPYLFLTSKTPEIASSGDFYHVTSDKQLLQITL